MSNYCIIHCTEDDSSTTEITSKNFITIVNYINQYNRLEHAREPFKSLVTANSTLLKLHTNTTTYEQFSRENKTLYVHNSCYKKFTNSNTLKHAAVLDKEKQALSTASPLKADEVSEP